MMRLNWEARNKSTRRSHRSGRKTPEIWAMTSEAILQKDMKRSTKRLAETQVSGVAETPFQDGTNNRGVVLVRD